jgi:hypothetical protein
VSITANTAASVDYAGLVTNLGIFVAFITAAVVGIWQGVKKLRKDSDDQIMPRDIRAATIMENITLSEWSQSNRDVIAGLAEVKRALYHQCDVVIEHGKDMRELAHQIERLRDKINDR